MYLKSIEIKGFKSFAEKINLEFDKGIAAIVGPNGSGKSNIADAVRWVLGEQSIKNLRGSKMEDVIFSGTDTRKALGFAEVSITLDNGDGFLPIEYSEVVVTRRLFRSGESEYYLNRTGCRLKDINELFMDTGIGKEGYSIIGQGRIDEVLSSKAEDRRKIFEEAAGIVKYKTRKDEAERKLQRTEENLLRLGDIIDELQRQVGPLYEQSEVAKAYILMRDELKKLELSLFIDSLEKLNRQKTDIQEKVKECRKQVYNKNNMVNRLETEFSSLETRIQQLDEELKEVQERVFRSLNLAEKKEGEIKVLNQRIQGEKENIERHKTEIAETENETAALEEEKQKRMQEMQDLKKELEGKKQIIDTFQANLDSIGAQVGKDEAKVEEIKTGIIENLNRISELNSKANSLKTLNQTIYMRKAQLLEEMQNIDDRIGALKAERDDLKKTLDGLEKQLTENARRRSGLVNKLDSLRNQRLLLEQKQKNLR
ncbi:MAG TPA: AAA family ATPase, partial [Bacillota bacterium]|nr:AAA family ATPase [Bacillota bacterium]